MRLPGLLHAVRVGACCSQQVPSAAAVHAAGRWYSAALAWAHSCRCQLCVVFPPHLPPSLQLCFARGGDGASEEYEKHPAEERCGGVRKDGSEIPPQLASRCSNHTTQQAACSKAQPPTCACTEAPSPPLLVMRAPGRIEPSPTAVVDACVSTMAWWAVGYAFAYGTCGDSPFIGALVRHGWPAAASSLPPRAAPERPVCGTPSASASCASRQGCQGPVPAPRCSSHRPLPHAKPLHLQLASPTHGSAVAVLLVCVCFFLTVRVCAKKLVVWTWGSPLSPTALLCLPASPPPPATLCRLPQFLFS
jgi:hypothetical protein